MIRLITDGACEGNPGPGGWAAILISETNIEELGGFEPHTTNNRMELQAAIEGLRKVTASEPVQVVTDSQYLLKGITEWLPGWKRRGWRTSSGNAVENRDLWEELDGLVGSNVTWEWVHGHAGHPENERADQIAQAYSKGQPVPRSKLRIGEPSLTYDVDPSNFNRPPGDSYLSLVNGVLMRHTNWPECEARVKGIPNAHFKRCKSIQEELQTISKWQLDAKALLDLNTITNLEAHTTNEEKTPLDASLIQQIARPPGDSYLSWVDEKLARHTSWESCQLRVSGVKADYVKCKNVEDEIKFVRALGKPVEILVGLSAMESPSISPAFFPRTFLKDAENHLIQSDFLPVTSSGSEVAFRVSLNRAICEAYTSGNVQLQGSWSPNELALWGNLVSFGENWIEDKIRLAANCLAKKEEPTWDEIHLRYLRRLLFDNRLPGWKSEPIGRYLYISQSDNNQPAGVLGESEWKTLPTPDISTELWLSLRKAQDQPDRWCAALFQPQDVSLHLAVVPLTKEIKQLAQLWDWEAVSTAAADKQAYVLKILHPHIRYVSSIHWSNSDWKQKANILGNQLDLIYSWLSKQIMDGSADLGIAPTWPLDLIMKPTGNVDWAHRLLEQRTEGKIKFRQSLMPEEIGGEGLAAFLAQNTNMQGGMSHG